MAAAPNAGKHGRDLNLCEPATDTFGVSFRPRRPAPESVRLSDVFSALSFALDLTEGQPMGHALRSCLIAMELGGRVGLPLQLQRDLYYAALLKDVGCSSNASQVFALFGGDDRLAKGARMRVDWSNYFRAAAYAMSHTAPGASLIERARRVAGLARGGSKVATKLVQVRCERGAEIVRQLGLGEGAAVAVRDLDEHWDGRGEPRGLRGEEIPIVARILTLAQTLEVFAMRGGPAQGLQVVRERAGRWFDPLVVAACEGLERPLSAWCALETRELTRLVTEAEPGGAALLGGPRAIDRIAQVFAEVVDAKSPFTGAHSQRMTQLAVSTAIELGWSETDVNEVRRAALLHDLGKLTVPNMILDKPGALTPSEWEVMRMHSYYTERILEHVQGFEWLAFASAAHHERLDGSGYCRGLHGEQIPALSRVLAVADVYDALSTRRPYRPALSPERTLVIMERDRGTGLCSVCLDGLIGALECGGLESGEQREAA
jgi:HD-GYP domain-containing protein (c-di-GMP phosphodiesterase class II)